MLIARNDGYFGIEIAYSGSCFHGGEWVCRLGAPEEIVLRSGQESPGVGYARLDAYVAEIARFFCSGSGNEKCERGVVLAASRGIDRVSEAEP